MFEFIMHQNFNYNVFEIRNFSIIIKYCLFYYKLKLNDVYIKLNLTININIINQLYLSFKIIQHLYYINK